MPTAFARLCCENGLMKHIVPVQHEGTVRQNEFETGRAILYLAV